MMPEEFHNNFIAQLESCTNVLPNGKLDKISTDSSPKEDAPKKEGKASTQPLTPTNNPFRHIYLSQQRKGRTNSHLALLSPKGEEKQADSKNSGSHSAASKPPAQASSQQSLQYKANRKESEKKLKATLASRQRRRKI
eukprot:CAMPEP_0117764746 /NCGR_PEP_ID=MMETSP0947-20121206/19615_1 /TAXON_ID=44440 /ORGANISM="Chattonella subsalsa, Strain CCMP2191" /LENGTH=137 /DNA_ID=CAMNT_0005587099 /DNA_START=1 /DNA_END=414 /DNA_ORIENTATION=-